jgi:maleamate amidohydrolase
VTYGFCGSHPEPILSSMRRFRSSSGDVAWRAAAVIERLIAAARLREVPIIYTRGMTPGEQFSPGKWAAKNRRATEDTDRHHEILDPIRPEPRDVVLPKAKPSAFFGTPLAAILVELGVDSLIVCGGTTSGCVRASVVDAFSYNYSVSVVRDATFDRIKASHCIALLDMDMKYADVIGSDAAVASLVPDRSANT